LLNPREFRKTKARYSVVYDCTFNGQAIPNFRKKTSRKECTPRELRKDPNRPFCHLRLYVERSSHQNLEKGPPGGVSPTRSRKRPKSAILSSTIVRGTVKPPKPGKGTSRRGLSHQEPEKTQIGHSVIYDCTWNGQATKTWKRDLPEGSLPPGAGKDPNRPSAYLMYRLL
jgi:hypothetical protein